MPNYSSGGGPNTNEGVGRIPYRASKRKRHKSQPHKNPHKKRPTQRWQDKPLFPGGITTQGQFDASRNAATNLQFRDEDQQVAQEEKAIPGWYNDYLKKLQGLQTQTTQQYQGLQSQATSLAEKIHGATPEGQKAAEARNLITQAVTGALQQQQGAAFTRNQEMGAVATGRQAQRQEELGTAKTKLARAKGDFKTEYTAKGKQTEFENALAAKQFGLKVEDAKTERINALKKPKAETTYDKQFSTQAAKYGYSRHDWAMMGPRGRAQRIQEAAKRSGSQPKTLKRIEREEATKIATRNGYSVEDWLKLPASKRSAIIHGKKPGKDEGTEITYKSGITRSRGAKQVAAWKNDPQTSKIVGKGNRRAHAKQILGSSNAPDDPALVSALMDSLYDGHLSREVARRLHVAGYKVSEIARALDTQTYTEWSRTASKPYSRKKGKKIKSLLNPFD